MDRADHLYVTILDKALLYNNRKWRSRALSGYGLFLGNTGNPDSALSCHKEAARLNKALGDSIGVVTSLANEGTVHYHIGNVMMADSCFMLALQWMPESAVLSLRAQMMDNFAAVKREQGRISEALELSFRSLALREKDQNKLGMGWTCLSIAALYEDQEEWMTATEMVDRAIALFNELNNPAALAEAYFSRASIAQKRGHGQDAMNDYDTSIKYSLAAGDATLLPRTWGSMAQIALDQQQLDIAKIYLARSDSAEILQGSKGEYITNLLTRAGILKAENKIQAAVIAAEDALALARDQGLLESKSLAAYVLAGLYTQIGRWEAAYASLNEHMNARDSLKSIDNAKRAVQAQLQYAYGKQQLTDSLRNENEKAIQAEEIQKQKLARNGLGGGFAVVATFAGVFFIQRNRIRKEKARSEELLLNILPSEVAAELKVKGEADARMIEQATVLFTDFKGFTALSEQLTPQQLVHDLHACFSAFDEICTRYGIEKIKTIGDSYMAAGGLPTPNHSHPKDAINAALEIRDIIQQKKERNIADGKPYFEVRIGLHTGPLVAGIVGLKKFQYDIWGDTVNTASRMESSGMVGQVNISGATYRLVKDERDLEFTYRGSVEAKGKGLMEMYFVEKNTFPA